MPIYYTIGTSLTRFFFTLFARCQVEGKEAIPPKGPLIVVSNHISNADVPLLAMSLPRKLFFMAKGGLFKGPIASSILDGLGVHRLKREGTDVAALRWALRLLERDVALLIFPEATRSRTAPMNRAGPGVGYLALKTQVPILPVAITGTEGVSAMWRVPFPFCRMNVRIGEPFTLPIIEGKLTRSLLEHATEMIMYRLASLLPERYRGYYQTPAPTPSPL